MSHSMTGGESSGSSRRRRGWEEDEEGEEDEGEYSRIAGRLSMSMNSTMSDRS